MTKIGKIAKKSTNVITRNTVHEGTRLEYSTAIA
jgi:hypothetical protein